MARACLLALLLALPGCPPPQVTAPIPPVSTGKVRVRVFTEPSPVRVLTSVGGFVFASTEHDLERWDAKGTVLPLSAESLSGTEIIAVASDPERRRIWVLTDDGLGHYDTAAEVFREQAPPPTTLGLDLDALAEQGASLAASVDGSVWIGTQAGLYYVSEQGGWTATAIKDPIRALARNASGWLFMATPDGLAARKPTGETVHIGPAMGCAITSPRILVELPEDRLLVIGTDAANHERLAIGKDASWITYRALPDVSWEAAAPRGTGAVVMGGGRLYHLATAVPGRVRPLARDGLRLLAVSQAGTALDWVIDPLEVQPPPGAVSLTAADDQILIGTRDLGTARYRDGDVRPRDWLRRKQMVQDATALTVACATQRDCWIATGGESVWRWNGESFEAGGPENQIVVGVARDPDGNLYGIHRTGTTAALHISRITGDKWTELPNLTIEAPGDAPDIAFARFANASTLWLGLRYRDGIEMRSAGVAIVDLEAATSEMLSPAPSSIVDVELRGTTAWFASSAGVARLANAQLTIWTEGDGLRSDIARGIAITNAGIVLVATGAGAARWNGKAWDFPAALRFDINDITATRNGQVWMATDRGIAAWDGKKVRRVDTRRGLSENTILEVATDQYDRVWARGAGSLTLISQ